MNKQQIEKLQYNLIKGQVQPNISPNELLQNSFLKTIRSNFVPDSYAQNSYQDSNIILEANVYLPSAVIAAKMIEAMSINPSHTILIVGDATGYLTALISELCFKVYNLTEQSSYTKTASENLKKLSNVFLHHDQLEDGYMQGSPFDTILLAGAVNFIPDKLLSQLKSDGSLFAPIINNLPRVGHELFCNFVKIFHHNNQYSQRNLFTLNVPPLKMFNDQVNHTIYNGLK